MNVKALLPLLILLGGCLQPGNALGPSADASCHEIYCLEPLAPKPAELLQERYGVDGWTLTPNTFVLDFESWPGYATWWLSRYNGDTSAGDILGLNLATQELFPLETGGQAQSTHPQANGDDVAFHQRSLEDGIEHLVILNRTTGQSRDLLWPLRGVPTVTGYDGDWIAVSVFQGGNDTGEYVFNVHDRRVIQLYDALPTARNKNGTGELFSGMVLREGRAYLGILWNRDADGDPLNYKDYEDVIYVFDIENGTREVFQRFPMWQVNYMDIGSRYITWGVVASGQSRVWAKDWRTGELHGPWTGPGVKDYEPRTEGDWVVYHSEEPGVGHALVAVHVPSNTTHVLIPIQYLVLPTYPDTDGQNVYFLGARLDDELFGRTVDNGDTIMDLYRMPLPPVPT